MIPYDNPIVSKARLTAEKLHAGQTRKASTLPYFTHLEGVAEIISRYSNSPHLIAAGYLHDTLEDVDGYTYEHLKADFGWLIADLVLAVSEDDTLKKQADKKGTWKERKIRYLDHLKDADESVTLLSSADRLYNLVSLVEDLRSQGDLAWNKFNSSPQDQLWFYGSFYEIVADKIPETLRQEMMIALQELEQFVH